jgi:adenylosuccinate synthase
VSTEPRAFIVVDLGFGDAGKGLLTDYLVRREDARLVVRFNGGAQAGHNVVTVDGRHHTFSQLGAGSFVPGVRTHLARDVVVHPTALGVEARHLAAKGVPEPLSLCSVDPRCRVTTPFHQAANRIRELRRGDAAHGSCGVGVGETVQDSLEQPELTVRFEELLWPERARDKLVALAEAKRLELAHVDVGANGALRTELALLADRSLPDRWLAAASDIARRVRCLSDEELAAAPQTVVFEGAQGVLLDERYGFYPHTSRSRCTFDGAQELLSQWQFRGPVERIGLLRTYAVRHGAGPFPTEDQTVSDATREPHNEHGPWQKHVRKGWLDTVLLDYAQRACGGLDALALTHLDELAALPDYRCCVAYRGIASLPVPGNIAEQARLTAEVASAVPEYRRVQASELRSLLSEISNAPVRFESEGPTAAHVRAVS